MATRFSPYSPASLRQETHQSFRNFFTPRRRSSVSSWVPRFPSSFRSTECLPLKSANGHPIDATPSQDGSTENHVAKHHVIDPEDEDWASFHFTDSDKEKSTLTITVVGASGDLAKKKIFPALFALFYDDHLPEDFTVFGYARTKLSDEELRNLISGTLTCRIDKRENCEDKMDHFLKRCFYHSGQYSSEDDFAELDSKMRKKEVM